MQRYGFEDAAREIQELYLDGKKDEAAAAIPPELIDTVALVGPRDRVRERLAVYRDAGVGTLIAAPIAVDPAEQAADGPRAGGDALSRRFLVAAFGDPGHAFPAIALGAELARRGHEVTLETWSRWREAVEREGMRFAAAPEYAGVSRRRTWSLKPYVAAVRASGSTREVIRECDPEVVVADIITVGGVAGRAGGGAPLGHADPARDAHGRARLPDLLDRRGVPAHAARRGASGRGRDRSS